MFNVKQSSYLKTFAVVCTLLCASGLCLTAGHDRFAPAVKAQSQDNPAQAPERAAVNDQFPRARQCNPGSLQGSYADQAAASVIPGGFSPAVCTGVFNFDGNGNLTAKEAHSFNGQIIPEANYKGSYTVNANCTGVMTITSVEFGFTGKQNFAITEGNKEIFYVVTDPGVVSSGVMRKM